MAEVKKKLLVLGVHLSSEGYPNVRYRLEDLRASGEFEITEINQPMWVSEAGGNKGFIGRILKFSRLVHSHATVVWRYLWCRPVDVVYVPYPAVFVLSLLSWLPSRRKPWIVADVFISLYDTIVNDRKLIAGDSWRAKILFRIERKACEFADKLVVDTEQNADFLAGLFGISTSKIVPIVLSTNEFDFHAKQYSPRQDVCNVLFIGTLIPLHGTKIILDAISLLAGREDIHFTIIGDGQDAHLIESWQQSHQANITWLREWQSSRQLAEAIGGSDICLGIFSDGDKTQRVCPFKLYAYTAVGRAIITGDTLWTREAVRNSTSPVFHTVPVGDAPALAARIIALADNASERSRLAEASRNFYQTCLSNAIANEKFLACLNGINASPLKS